MVLTLRDLLAFDVMREARPEVLVEAGGLDRPVRWVHSSEIYEIGPLLFGGELLLTTGLGLAGPDAGARRHYVRQLAERGIAGLALELGRTFPAAPDELVDEARALALPLIALRAVVPFIRISQAANTAIVDGGSARLRLVDQAHRSLTEALLAGAGVGGVLASAGSLAGCPFVVLSSGGALVAGHGVGDHRDAWALVDAARLITPITVHGHAWGRLVAGPGSPLAEDDLVALLDRLAAVLALAVLLSGSPPSRRDLQAAALLQDLADGAALAPADVRLRAGLVGFDPAVDDHVIGVAVDGPESGPARALLERVSRRLGTPRLFAAVRGNAGGGVLALLTLPADTRDPVGSLASAVDESRSRIGAPEVTAALGHAVRGDAGPGDLGATLRRARAALRIAVADRTARPTRSPGVVTARELALDLDLLEGRTPTELAALADSLVGPLLAWDRDHRSELVHTLEVLLRHGGSPTRAAAALHLGRQSLYQRIERIETLLGHPVDRPELVPSLLLGACAARLATRSR